MFLVTRPNFHFKKKKLPTNAEVTESRYNVGFFEATVKLKLALTIKEVKLASLQPTPFILSNPVTERSPSTAGFIKID